LLRRHATEDHPSPALSGLTSANIDEAQDVKLLFECLAELFGDLGTTPDYEELARTMTRLGVLAEERKQFLDEPFAAERLRTVEQQMKDLSPANREAIKQFVIFGELTTGAVRFKVKNSGADMNQWLVPEVLSSRTGWLTSRPGNASYDDMEQNVYAINAEMRPILRDYFAKQNWRSRALSSKGSRSVSPG
jgi:hypothetical protein